MSSVNWPNAIRIFLAVTGVTLIMIGLSWPLWAAGAWLVIAALILAWVDS